MSYKIIIDSCGELTEDMKATGHFENVALGLSVGDYHILDDENFNQIEFLQKVDACEEGAKSTCPSPDAYMKAMETDAEHIYMITLSSQLSGSYNSAVLAKNLFDEENEGHDKQVYVIDSKSASIGESLIGMKVRECEEAGKSFQETIEIAEAYRDEMNTFFVLESLDTLRKNGRLSNIKAFVASKLNIKPVMGSTDEGSIQQLDQARGMNKALDKMVAQVKAATRNCEDKVIAISHCNNEERAQMVKAKIQEVMNFKDVIVINTRGVSSMYANQGGIIIAV